MRKRPFVTVRSHQQRRQDWLPAYHDKLERVCSNLASFLNHYYFFGWTKTTTQLSSMPFIFSEKPCSFCHQVKVIQRSCARNWRRGFPAVLVHCCLLVSAALILTLPHLWLLLILHKPRYDRVLHGRGALHCLAPWQEILKITAFLVSKIVKVTVLTTALLSILRCHRKLSFLTRYLVIESRAIDV